MAFRQGVVITMANGPVLRCNAGTVTSALTQKRRNICTRVLTAPSKH